MEQEKIKYKHFLVDETKYRTLHTRKFGMRKPYELPNPMLLKSLLPGKILKMNVKVGDNIRRGDILCVLEAMKMENRIRASFDARVKAVLVAEGETISTGHPLVEFEESC